MNRKILVIEFILVAGMVLMLLSLFRERQIKPEQPAFPTVTVTHTPTVTPTKKPTETPSPSPTFTPTPTVTPTPIPEGKKVDSGHAFKPYTGHWAYTNKNSQQYALQRVAETAENGIRVVRDEYGIYRYCVALGTYWAGGMPKDIGRCLDVYMVNGAVLHCVLADVKQQQHTKGGNNKYGSVNNDFLEFIVDDKKLSQAVRNCGNVSKAGEEFEGDAWQIVVLDYWIVGFGN